MGGGFLARVPAAPNPRKSFMQPRIYTYKVTFEETPYWYWGVHKEKKFGESYLGSPTTHKWVWEFYTPKVQILELFAPTAEGWAEAQLVEKRLIRPDLNNPLCLNEGCGSVLSLESCVMGGKIQGPLNRGRKHTEKALENFKKGHSTPEAVLNRSRSTKEVFSRPGVIESVTRKAIERWKTRKEELSASMRGVKVGYHWWVNQAGGTRQCPNSPGNDWQPGRTWRAPYE